MGIDDDAVKTVRDWRFTPAMLGDKPHAVHARVIFDIESTNPLQP
jgi:outer membrane biosynthesis protein TonB